MCHRRAAANIRNRNSCRSTPPDILFVCGGAFTGLEKIISARNRPGSIGYGAKVIAPEDRKQGEIFRRLSRRTCSNTA